MDGYVFTILGAVSLAWTVIFDKLAVTGDCYNNNKNAPWFVSSLLGSIFGLIATMLAWLLHGDIAGLAHGSISLLEQGVSIWGHNAPFALLMFVSGVVVSLTQRSYFKSFEDVEAGVIAVVIAITPVAIFGLSVMLDGDNLGIAEILSLATTVTALIGYGYFAHKQGGSGVKNHYGNLFLFLTFSTIYLVLIDRSLAGVSGANTVEGVLISLPYYWLGFGTGSLTFFKKDVRKFLSEIFRKKRRYVKYILLMEVVGMLFYFFEVFGLGELSVTLTALIIGAHVVFVWMFDIYLNRRHAAATRKNRGEIGVLFTVLKTKDVEVLSLKTIVMQAFCIGLALAGIVIWP